MARRIWLYLPISSSSRSESWVRVRVIVDFNSPIERTTPSLESASAAATASPTALAAIRSSGLASVSFRSATAFSASATSSAMACREDRLLGAAFSAISGTSLKENDCLQGLSGYPRERRAVNHPLLSGGMLVRIG